MKPNSNKKNINQKNQDPETMPGYKLTSLGWIPEEWEVWKISDVFNFVNTFSFSRENLSNEKTFGELFYIHYGDIHSKFENEILDLNIDEVPYLKDGILTEKNIDDENFPFLKEGDLIIADVSEDYTGVGECIELKNVNEKKILSGLHTFALRDKENKTVAGFRTYIFRHPNISRNIKRIATGFSVYGISKGNLSKLLIPLPLIKEQVAIANILCTWDKSISTLSSLIKQKELRKKWLMHQLLTGKRRVKGFEKEKLKESQIKDVSMEISIRNKNNKVLTVLSCTKYHGLVPSLEYFGRKIFSNDLSTYKIIPKNHFAYATNHIEEGSIGYQEIFDEALISPMYTVFKTDDTINDFFFFKLLKSYKCIHEFQTRMEGTIDRRGGLRWDAFSIIKIHVPSLIEQNAISNILMTVDKEIQLLKSQLEKLKEQKKGLMQVLLTGKKRIKIN